MHQRYQDDQDDQDFWRDEIAHKKATGRGQYDFER